MSLLLVFAVVAVVLFALFWGGSLVAQGYFYSEPAERLPLRALVAAGTMAAFLTGWTALDRKNPDRYGTLFESSAYETRDFDRIEAVRWQVEPAAQAGGKAAFKKDEAGKPAEATVKAHRVGGKAAPFLEPDGRKFQLQERGSMTAAIIAPVGENGAPVRFDADVKDDPRTGTVYATDEKRFTEAGGGTRYLVGTRLGTAYVPSTTAIFVALFINAFHYALWLVLFWLVLRFSLGHAFAFAAFCGVTTMLLVMPMLFKPSRPPAAPVPVPQAQGRPSLGLDAP